MSSKLAVLLCLVAATAAGPHRVPRIAGGHSVELGERPYYVSLYNKHTLAHYPITHCGGAIINEQWILTAAYCVGQYKDVDVLVQAGNIYYKETSDTQQRSGIVASFVHPGYQFGNPTGPHDIALLKLETPLEFNDYVKPIALPSAGSEPTGYGTVTGLGSLKHMMSVQFPQVLQTVDLPIITYDACDKLLDEYLGDMKEEINLLDETRFCTGPTPTNQGYCLHDTGDPFVVKDEIVGVATFGFAADCEKNPTPSIFIRVSAHVDWIQETISKN
ncbi:hypothetical protein TSAR_014231 [Trichomalopsis sarcophagae]|uniref:Peptidase S1 domain-containing protein n=1 Tax=Trichomalopsis sarcophagae TaxID=543379 RepID=A0A232FK15_9HYME|nr:hypothetical protein TSAR_014231 [Trichomalopsis sarcophagae]